MLNAVAVILTRGTHPLVSLPVVLQVSNDTKSLSQLQMECSKLGMTSLSFGCSLMNILDSGMHHATYAERAQASLLVVTSYFSEAELPVAWLMEPGSITCIATHCPTLAQWMWQHLADPLTPCGFSCTSVVQVLDRSLPLSLHHHQFSRSITFSSTSQRSALVDNIGTLWMLRMTATLGDVARHVTDYLGVLRVGFDLKTLRWAEVHALQLCLRHLSGSSLIPLTTYLDVVEMILRRLTSNSLLSVQQPSDFRPVTADHRPTTAASRRIGRIGASNDDEERLELVCVLVKACASLVRECSLAAVIETFEVAQHRLWSTLAELPWKSTTLIADERSVAASALLTCVDAVARLIGKSVVAPHLFAVPGEVSDNSVAMFYTHACDSLTNVMGFIPAPPPLELSLPLCSLVAVLAEIAAARVTTHVASWRFNPSPTKATVMEQEALRGDLVYSKCVSSFFEWQVAMSMVWDSLLSADDDAVVPELRTAFASAVHWLSWNFVAMSSSSHPGSKTTSVRPLLDDEFLDEMALLTITESMLNVLQNGGATSLGWRAVGLLYHMVDLEGTSALESHGMLWTHLLAGEDEPCDDARDALCSYITQQRVNIVIHTDTNQLLDYICAAVRRWPTFGVTVSKALLCDFGASSLLSDEQLQRLFSEVSNSVLALSSNARKDRNSFEQCAQVSGHYAALVRARSFSTWAEAFPDAVNQLRAVIQHLYHHGHTIPSACILSAAPTSATTPSEVGMFIHTLLLQPTVDSLEQCGALLRRWGAVRSGTWIMGLEEFCKSELLDPTKLDGLCDLLCESPLRHNVLSFLNEIFQLPLSLSEFILESVRNMKHPSLLCEAIVSNIRSSSDQCCSVARALTLGGFHCSVNGPRTSLIATTTPTLSTDTEHMLVPFPFLQSTIPQWFVWLESSTNNNAACSLLSSLVQALLFGPYVIDVSITTDATALTFVLEDIEKHLRLHEEWRRSIISASLTFEGVVPKSSAAASARTLMSTGLVTHELRGVWQALAAVLSARALGIEAPLRSEAWSGLVPSFF